MPGACCAWKPFPLPLQQFHPCPHPHWVALRSQRFPDGFWLPAAQPQTVQTKESAGEKNTSRYCSQPGSCDCHMLYQRGQMFNGPGGPKSQIPASGSVVGKEKQTLKRSRPGRPRTLLAKDWEHIPVPPPLPSCWKEPTHY